jgi:hypothetical protein
MRSTNIVEPVVRARQLTAARWSARTMTDRTVADLPIQLQPLLCAWTADDLLE